MRHKVLEKMGIKIKIKKSAYIIFNSRKELETNFQINKFKFSSGRKMCSSIDSNSHGCEY